MQIQEDCIVINLNALPVDGKANDELIRFISKQFKIQKNSIEFVRGEKSKVKVLRMELNQHILDLIAEMEN